MVAYAIGYCTGVFIIMCLQVTHAYNDYLSSLGCALVAL